MVWDAAGRRKSAEAAPAGGLTAGAVFPRRLRFAGGGEHDPVGPVELYSEMVGALTAVAAVLGALGSLVAGVGVLHPQRQDRPPLRAGGPARGPRRRHRGGPPDPHVGAHRPRLA